MSPDPKKKNKVGDKVKTANGEFEVVAVNDDGSCMCKCVETGEQKLLTADELKQAKK